MRSGEGNLHSFEAKVVVIEVFVIDDCGIEFFGVGHDGFVRFLRNHGAGLLVLGVDVIVQVMDDLGKLLLGLLVQVRHSNPSTPLATLQQKAMGEREGGPSGKDGIVGMLGGHVRCGLSGEIVKFDGRDALPVSFHPLIDVSVDVGGGETCLVDSGDDFLRDGDRVNVVRVETITESAHACRDLNKRPRQHYPPGNAGLISLEKKQTLSN